MLKEALTEIVGDESLIGVIVPPHTGLDHAAEVVPYPYHPIDNAHNSFRSRCCRATLADTSAPSLLTSKPLYEPTGDPWARTLMVSVL